MADISLGRALGSGFALIRRRPASVLVWGLLIVLFVQAPILVCWGGAWLAPVILIAAAIIGGLNAIVVAPWATAYGQLNNSPNARA